MNDTAATSATAIAKFIDVWQKSAAAERANYALFLTQLCDILAVAEPNPTTDDPDKNTYVFERDVVFDHGDGTATTGRIDLYKRGCFVLEAKQGSDAQAAEDEEALLAESRGSLRDPQPPTGKTQPPKRAKKRGTAVRGTKAWDDAMIRARGQADRYARALPSSEGWPPFLIVVDVGHSIELYSEFTRQGKTYVPFPDPQSFRIKLADLADEKIRERLRLVWSDPLALDPSKKSAKVTRELASRLAELAKLLEHHNHDPARVARFLMRCLFTMFAEDVELIPKDAFKKLLAELEDTPENFRPMVEALWQTMDTGGFSTILRQHIARFNGGLFAEHEALNLSRPMLKLLRQASESFWGDVEPAIFGTLLERALNPIERHKLGAHYTPRAYVERLVMPTIIEPLRDEWNTIYATALTHARAGEMTAAHDAVRHFHEKLCETRVLDPACGSGNFLYVTLEHMKRLEGEVLNALRELGYQQKILLEIDPHQFLGIELNPRAAAIADLVLWIGYLQWHFRTRGKAQPAEPIIKNFKNIECRDAVLAWDHTEPLLDDSGQPVTRWDGRTTKQHPVTGEQVPDETAQVPVVKYINPRKAEWPKTDYIVSNPPFIGNKRMRLLLSDPYVEALREAHEDVEESADYVMYWWNIAGTLACADSIRRFGFITTNSITQHYSRKMLERFLKGDPVLSIVFAVPDHPWVDNELGAAVRIAMTVGMRGIVPGRLMEVFAERPSQSEEAQVELLERRGAIQANLRVGAALSDATPLLANEGICQQGVKLVGDGFLVDESIIATFSKESLSRVKPFLSNRDLVQRSRDLQVIDFHGLSESEARESFPDAYQRVNDTVRPFRMANRDPQRKRDWWLFGRSNERMRASIQGLARYIATPEVAKHRPFCFVSSETIPDASLYVIGVDDAFTLGVLSSRVHVDWAIASGGTLEDRPRYQNGPCFLPFPFPDATENQKNAIGDLAEQLDDLRKRRQEQHPWLTLTDMYNVLEKLRAGEPLNEKDQRIHHAGFVSVLQQLHDDLDAAVFAAYGWPPTLTDEQILTHLVALNSERASEESRGLVRWLRPDFQAQGRPLAPQAPEAETTSTLDDSQPRKKRRSKVSPSRSEGTTLAAAAEATLPSRENEHDGKRSRGPGRSGPARPTKLPWPKELSARTKAIQDALAAATSPLTSAKIAGLFLRARQETVEDILNSLVSIGYAHRHRGGKYTT